MLAQKVFSIYLFCMQNNSHWMVIRLGSLGDVVLTTGVLAWWAKTHGWTFSVLTKAAFASVFDGHPAVREVISLQDEDLPLRRIFPFFRNLAKVYAGCGLLDLHDTPRSRLLALLWQGNVLRFKKLALARRIFLLSHGRYFRKLLNSCNVPQRYASAAETLMPDRAELLPCIFPADSEKACACEIAVRMVAAFPAKAPLLALHPYAAHPGKAWHGWHELMYALDQKQYPWFVIGQSHLPLSGIPAERDFTNRSSLRETCALLDAADVLITGDSGPMHLASAVRTPVIALFGPTTREWGFMPEGKQDTILQTSDLSCRPCSLHGQKKCMHQHQCMRAITAQQILEAIRQLFPRYPAR